MLFIVDCALKYGFRLNLSYQEKNGGIFYASPYFQNKIKNKLGLLGPNPDVLYKREEDAGTSRIEEKKEFSYIHRFNSFGLRGKEPDNSPDTYKILALGDSFTEGVGAPEDSTWIHILAQKIAESRSKKVTYLNGGLSGSDPFLSFRIMKEVTKKYKPDLVVLMMNSSDISDYYNVGGKERFDPNIDGIKIPVHGGCHFTLLHLLSEHVFIHLPTWITISEIKQREFNRKKMLKKQSINF
jgi:lysophospholipase L1-like esterase